MASAEKRKESLQNEKAIIKIAEGINFFKKHWIIRQEETLKSIKIYEMNEQNMRKNIEVMKPTNVFIISCIKYIFFLRIETRKTP